MIAPSGRSYGVAIRRPDSIHIVMKAAAGRTYGKGLKWPGSIRMAYLHWSRDQQARGLSGSMRMFTEGIGEYCGRGKVGTDTLKKWFAGGSPGWAVTRLALMAFLGWSEEELPPFPNGGKYARNGTPLDFPRLADAPYVALLREAGRAYGQTGGEDYCKSSLNILGCRVQFELKVHKQLVRALRASGLATWDDKSVVAANIIEAHREGWRKYWEGNPNVGTESNSRAGEVALGD